MSKLLLTYFSFVAACVIVVLAFITATNYIQLAVAILLYPLLVLFAYKVLPQRKRTQTSTQPAAAPQPQVKTAKEVENASRENARESVGINDIDKRVFLKLIGGAGLFLFLFSIFNKKAEGLFFKNASTNAQLNDAVFIKDPAGSKINPAQNQPLDGYNISEVDDKDIAYYGYTNKDGAWFVMKVDSLLGSFRYAKGDRDFPNNWNKRENLKYEYYNEVF